MDNNIMQKLQEHDKRFDDHDRRFDAHDKRFDQLDHQVDFLATKMLEHDDRLHRIEETMVTKQDHQQVMESLDEILGLVRKTDQEITMMGHRMARAEEKVEEHDRIIRPWR